MAAFELAFAVLEGKPRLLLRGCGGTAGSDDCGVWTEDTADLGEGKLLRIFTVDHFQNLLRVSFELSMLD